jgi:hypothetical protein
MHKDQLARRTDAEREAVPVDMPSSPNPDCEACGGEGEDADPYGMFDYACYEPCPACYAHSSKEPT